MLSAVAAGFERSAYLHERSIQENCVRHFYYDSHPCRLVRRVLMKPEDVNDRWSEMVEEIKELPHFLCTVSRTGGRGDADGGKEAKAQQKNVLLFDELSQSYGEASRFVHGATYRHRSSHDSVAAVGIDNERSTDLSDSVKRAAEICYSLLALYHVGAYALIPQPIRRYALSLMDAGRRDRLIDSFGRLPVAWIRHQRKAALQLQYARRSGVYLHSGLRLEVTGVSSVVPPTQQCS